jgi:hypothetical protein
MRWRTFASRKSEDWRQSGFKAEQQLFESLIILPGGQCGREAIRQLIIGHQCAICFLDSQAYQWDAEIIGEEANGG